MGMGNVWDIGLLLVNHTLYVWCVSRFLKKHLQGSLGESWGFGGLLIFIRMVMSLFLQKIGIPYILYALCSHGVFVGLAGAAFRGEREKKLMAAVALTVMTELIWNFSESFLCCAWLMVARAFAGPEPMVGLGAGAVGLISFLTYGAGVTAINRLSKPLAPVLADKRKSWYLAMTAPLLCVVLVTDLANWAASNGIMVQGRGDFGLYENQLFSHGAMCVFTGVAMAASGLLIFGMDRIERQEQARERYRSQVMYYEMMEEQYGQMERLRHDMKNHLLALDNLVRNRQWDKACDYLKEMAGAGGVGAEDEVTGSLVIDALLYHKRRQAKKLGICWQCDAKLPDNCPVREIDLCIIAGNMLDNGLEACERMEKMNGGTGRFIRVYMGKVKKCLLLETQNSTGLGDGWEAQVSRKECPKEHGLGLVNIKGAAARYHGVVHTQVEHGTFIVSVLLPLCKAAGDDGHI